jgi:hypothetical protein
MCGQVQARSLILNPCEEVVWQPERDGLIHTRPGADKRIRIVFVTNKGRKLVDDAEPKWSQAQEGI